MSKRDIGREAIRLSQGDKVSEALPNGLEYRRVKRYWLRETGEYIRSLEFELRETRAILRQLVKDWDLVPENVQVPDAINENEHWQRAREILREDNIPNNCEE
jgi:hypothetical protein